MVSVPERRRVVTYLRGTYAVSERRACKVIPISRTTYRHSGTRPVVDETYTELVRLSHQYPYWGYRKIFALMDQDRFEIGREGGSLGVRVSRRVTSSHQPLANGVQHDPAARIAQRETAGPIHRGLVRLIARFNNDPEIPNLRSGRKSWAGQHQLGRIEVHRPFRWESRYPR